MRAKAHLSHISMTSFSWPPPPADPQPTAHLYLPITPSGGLCLLIFFCLSGIGGLSQS